MSSELETEFRLPYLAELVEKYVRPNELTLNAHPCATVFQIRPPGYEVYVIWPVLHDTINQRNVYVEDLAEIIAAELKRKLNEHMVDLKKQGTI